MKLDSEFRITEALICFKLFKTACSKLTEKDLYNLEKIKEAMERLEESDKKK